MIFLKMSLEIKSEIFTRKPHFLQFVKIISRLTYLGISIWGSFILTIIPSWREQFALKVSYCEPLLLGSLRGQLFASFLASLHALLSASLFVWCFGWLYAHYFGSMFATFLRRSTRSFLHGFCRRRFRGCSVIARVDIRVEISIVPRATQDIFSSPWMWGHIVRHQCPSCFNWRLELNRL